MENKTENFISKAKLIHGDKYDYSKVNYINKRTNVKIICSEHGVFEQLVHNHLKGNGCIKCSGKGLTNEEFINKCNIVHKNKFNYSLVDYKNCYEKIKIICPIHDKFEQTPSSHISGVGCWKCFNEDRTTSNNEFILKAEKVHSDKYNYSKIIYLNSKVNITIICPIHGDFEQTPNMHLKGCGCRKCGYITVSKKAINNSHSFSLSSWKNIISKNIKAKPMLYIIKCYNDTEEFIKIGITINNLKGRYPSNKHMPYKYDIILTHEAEPELVFNIEKALHRYFKKIKYTPTIKFHGMGECYYIKDKPEILNYCNKQLN
jgi:hypothetical protein